MNCIEAEALMSELFDGELGEDAARGVSGHIEACEVCAREYRALSRTVRFVQGNAATQIAPGTPGAVYDDCVRAIVDESFGMNPAEVAMQFLAPKETPEERNKR